MDFAILGRSAVSGLARAFGKQSCMNAADQTETETEAQIPQSSEPQPSSQPLEQRTSQPLSALVATALSVQQQIREQSSELPAAAYAHTLPCHSILVAQYRKDRVGTLALISARVKALDEDIDATFSRFNGRKSQARELMAALKEDLQTLEESGSEIDLIALLSKLGQYEQTFDKDSWLAMANLVFIGLDKLLASPLAQQLRKLVAPELLSGDASTLLNPASVTKYNAGHLSQDPTGLSRLLEQFAIDQGRSSLIARTQNTLATLTARELPAIKEIMNPVPLAKQLCQSHPELVNTLINLYFESAEYGNNDEEALASSREARFHLARCPDDADALSGVLSDILKRLPDLAEHIGKLAQQRYLDLAMADLGKQVDTCLQAGKPVPAELCNTLEQQLQQTRTLALKLGREVSAGQIGTQLHNVALLRAFGIRKVIDNDQLDDQQLWQLSDKPSLEQIAAALKGRESVACAPAIRALRDYLDQLRNPSVGFKASCTQLRLKDQLLKAQQELLLRRARIAVTKTDSDFQPLCQQIRQLDALRSMAAPILQDGLSWRERARNLGFSMVRGQELPVEHQLKQLELEWQLQQQGYNFEDEAWKIVTDLPALAQTLKSKASNGVSFGRNNLTALLKGQQNLTETAFQLRDFSKESSETLIKEFKAMLTGAAAVAAKNPRLLRALNGNISQTMTNLGNLVGQSSPLYSMFSELSSRVWAESATTHFIDNITNESVALEQLSEQELDAVKRLVALSRMMESAPYIPKLLNTAMEACGNRSLLGLAWTFTKGAASLVYTRATQKNVNALDDEQLRACNAMLEIVQHGPAAAAHRERLMQQSGHFIAEVACRQSVVTAAAKTLFLQSFRMHGRSLVRAIRNFWKGTPNSRIELLVEIGKVASIVAPPALSTSMVLASIFTGGLVALVSSLSALAGSLFFAWRRSNYLASLSQVEDITKVVARHVHQQISASGINFSQQADTLLRESGYQAHIIHQARNHGAAEIYRMHWQQWAKSSPENTQQAERFEQELKQTIRQEQTSADSQHQIDDLMAKSALVSAMDQSDLSNNSIAALIGKLPEDELATLPQDKAQRIYWLLAVADRYREELYAVTGTRELPASREALAESLLEFTFARMAGTFLSEGFGYQPARRDGGLAAQQVAVRLRQWAKERLARNLEVCTAQAMNYVYSNRAKAWFSRGKYVTQSTFDKCRAQDEGLNQDLEDHVNRVIVPLWQTASSASAKSISRRLKAMNVQLTGDEIKALLKR